MRALAYVRTGIHWGAEEFGRRLFGLERHMRTYPHCPRMGGPCAIKDTAHIALACPVYTAERGRFSELSSPAASLHAVLEQPATCSVC